MTMAQRLYEAGHITYMRTDSTNLSNDAVNAAREYIQDQFGAQYIPENPIRYGAKEGAQEAHEAIRPSRVAGPVMRIAKPSSMWMAILPPGICTVMSRSQRPMRCATAAAALLLEPDARV